MAAAVPTSYTDQVVKTDEVAEFSPDVIAEMESRVRSIMLTPAMVLVWVLGLMLAFNVDAFSQSWFHAKLAMVIALTAYQGWLGAYGRKLASGVRPLSGRIVRMLNEIPGIAAAIIVVLVIVRPF